MTTRALVVYESMFGNTAEIAHAVSEGMADEMDVDLHEVSDAPAAAKYAGMRTRRKVIAVMALSGALAGLGGASDIGDIRHLLDPKGLRQAGYGYTGIVVAALARLNPLGVVVVSVLMGGLNNAGRSLQGPDFPAGLVGTLWSKTSHAGFFLLLAGLAIVAAILLWRLDRPIRSLH